MLISILYSAKLVMVQLPVVVIHMVSHKHKSS